MKSVVIVEPTEEENKAALDEFFADQRKMNAEKREAVKAAIPALERLCEVLKDRSGQPYKLRAILFSIWNGKPASLVEIVCLDWDIRKDLCAVLLAYGYDAPPQFEGQPSEKSAPDFFYDEIRTAITKAGQWNWFLEAGQEEAA